MTDLLKEFERWTPKDRERAIADFARIAETERKVWYCNRPRPRWRQIKFKVKGVETTKWTIVPGTGCDGAEHEGYPYRHARADQWPPPGTSWFLWFLMGGRGSGKTRSGAEYVRRLTSVAPRIALVGATNQAVRDVMVEGESGLRSVFAHAGEEINYEPSKRKITFPNGAVASLYTGEEPDRLRGPQHHAFWLDEPSHFPLIQDVWDQLMFGMRLGQRPHGVCTSTPLPNKWTKARIADDTTRMMQVSTFANLANLAPTFRDTIVARFEGTRLGRQELEGEILGDVDGALWSMDMLLHSNISSDSMQRIVVAIDPAGTTNKKSDETGIVVVGKRGESLYVLEDRSGKWSPHGWATEADRLYREYKADAIVAEKNFGGDMVKTTVESTGTKARIVVTTATRSKELRAEPIVALYEQGRAFHNSRGFEELEEEMVTWVPGSGPSPNRIDAMVHGATELFGGWGPATLTVPRSERPIARRAPGTSSPLQRRIRPTVKRFRP